MVNKINSLSKVLMNNSFYQVIPLEKPYFKKTKKKRPHISVAGWWGTLFLNQILKKCNPLSVAQALSHSYTTDSALMIFFMWIYQFWNNFVILKLICKILFFDFKCFLKFYLLKMSCTVSFVRTLLVKSFNDWINFTNSFELCWR